MRYSTYRLGQPPRILTPQFVLLFLVVGLAILCSPPAAFAKDDPVRAAMLQRLHGKSQLQPAPQRAEPARRHRPAAASAEQDNLWLHLSSRFSLADPDHPAVKRAIERYRRQTNLLDVINARAKRYLFHISRELDRRGMPPELALLPMVESGFDPFAYSPGQASGLWQFVPGTADYLKIRRNWWYDGRRDLLEGTDAALDYLQRHNKRFDGDWLLSLASYNAGRGTVNRAIRRNKKRGRPTDFWSLPLPAETRLYVPRLLALSAILKSPERYGYRLPNLPNKPYFAKVPTGGQIDLARAAELAGVAIDEIYRLNPGFNRWATDPEGPHHLLVPVAAGNTLRQRLAKMPPTERLQWQRYEVVEGDTLSEIALRFRTDTATIRASNRMNDDTIRAGQRLMVPVALAGRQHYTLSAKQRQIAYQNRINKPQHDRIFHRVREGESLWTIARRHNTTVKKLSRWNNLSPKDTIRPGQKLAVWRYIGSDEDRKIVRKVGYKVRSGDSLSRIAGRFNVRVSQIAEWNDLNPARYLQPGQSLTLYVDVTN